MKFVALFAVLLICVDLSLQLPQIVNCTSDFVTPISMADGCVILICDDSKSFKGLACPARLCSPGKEIGYVKEDDSKTYPECCGGPICAD